ncbi:hypothetical protein D7X94_05105 [Acutalibacter sp. 1XD8-33]|jgi:hypothetical protein|uniref:hypothetical protein n=1 Tax=Acutalibacter sp. 1XD8-33 TaxID=2320081 RepID=UPI000EA30BED|nr:hypothetical protein [Acutalibacter sp. 1XD8-33]RKJ41179.1 hypothetical protein D7X94_05105 [Acutalibacter sp. 1XD8-33]
MGELEEKKTVAGQDSGLPTLDMPQLDNMTAIQEMPPQPVEDVAESVPIAPETEPLHPQKKKERLIALAVALILGAVGGVTWFVIANSEAGGEQEEVLSEDDADKDGDSDKEPEFEPEPKPELKIVELSLDNEIVQTLFSEFNPITGSATGGTAFYAQALHNNLSRKKIMEIAFFNLTSSTCVGDYEIGLVNGETWKVTECYSGAEMRQEIKRLFGLDYTFTKDDMLPQICPHGYDEQNDEFHTTTIGCGGWFPAHVQRELYKAEKDEKRIYLYEMAVYVSPGGGAGCDGTFCRLGDNGLWSIVIDGLSSESIPSLISYPGADEIFDKFKWTFVWDGENYVFEALERV